MSFELDAADIARLSLPQKHAMLQSLYLVVAIDREINDSERKKLDEVVSSIAWGIELSAIRELWVGTRDRVIRTKEREEWLAWVDELAKQIPVQLQVPMLATMGRLAVIDDINQRERGLLNAFALAFGITQETAEQIKAALARG